MSKVLVTGATGFIGRSLVERLLGRGYRVVCLVRDTRAAEPLRAQGAELRAGDITDSASYVRLVGAVDCVYHLAGKVKAKSQAEFDQVNAGGAQSLAAACAQCESPPVLVNVSSQAASGPATEGRPCLESDPPRPVSLYGRSKLAGEVAVAQFADRVPSTIVRPPVVLGPGDPNQLLMYRPIARWGVHLVPKPGTMRLAVIHVADLVEGIIAAGERGSRLEGAMEQGGPPTGQGVYFLAADESPTYGELGQWIAEALGRRVRVFTVPKAGVWLTAATFSLSARALGRASIMNPDKAREALAGDWLCSTQRAKSELGFAPLRPMRERMRETLAWYRQHAWL